LASFNASVDTDLGVLIAAISGGLNLVASIKKERIRKATSTKGVMSVAVLFLGILTLGMFYKNFVLRFKQFQNP
jgi:hypothetical protein